MSAGRRRPQKRGWTVLIIPDRGEPRPLRLGFGLLIVAGVIGIGLGLGAVGAPVLLAGSLGANAIMVGQNGKLIAENSGLKLKIANTDRQHDTEMSAQKRDADRLLNIERAKVDSLTRQARQVTSKLSELQNRVDAIAARAGVGSAVRASTGRGGQVDLEVSDPAQAFDALDQMLEKTSGTLTRAAGPLEATMRREAAIPAGWPATGPITSGFGVRIGPRTGRIERHTGWDIAGGFGSFVGATAPGVVVEAGWTNVGYGQHVVIDHGYGYRTLYGHLSKIGVSVGQRVSAGDYLGNIGSTGNSTGPHLHYEVRVGNAPINPGPFLHRARPRYASLETTR
jgi:murein DD-endopeptidase MepM/ murein hydrolase activator NlpD